MMIRALNSSAVRLDEKKQTSLYDTPLRELFEEARKVAEEQYKVKKLPIQSEKKDDKDTESVSSLPPQSNEDLSSEMVKIKQILKEKIKEEVKADLTQNAIPLNTEPLNDEKASDTSANSANNAQASSAYNASQKQNSRTNDELTRLLAMMI